MTYKLVFVQSAKKEWDQLDRSIQLQFKKKLEERLQNPHVLKSALNGLKDCYKIKLRTLGYRLVYQVNNHELIIQVIAVGRRDKNLVYLAAKKRL
jgi:mRNA interferase RelE/StbE